MRVVVPAGRHKLFPARAALRRDPLDRIRVQDTRERAGASLDHERVGHRLQHVPLVSIEFDRIP